MGRTPGAKNKTPRELRAEGAHRMKEAKLKQRIEARDRKIEAMKKKSTPK